MDNLINETNTQLREIINKLETIHQEYEEKLKKNSQEIDAELATVQKYKDDFYRAKEKVKKMNDDIEGFEADYQNLVDKFKDDELANILIAANKEISAKIEERKKKIVRDKAAMNDIVAQAEVAKERLVKLTAEKKALELCLDKITDSYTFYTRTIERIIDFSESNRDNLKSFFETQETNNSFEKEIIIDEDEDLTEEDINELTLDSTEDNDDSPSYEESDEITFETDDEEDNDDNIDNVEDAGSDESEDEEDEEDEEDDDDDDTFDSVLEEVSIDDAMDFIENDEDNRETTIDDDVDDDNTSEEDDNELDFSSKLDLENVVNFDDSLEDDDSLYNEHDKNKEDE